MWNCQRLLYSFTRGHREREGTYSRVCLSVCWTESVSVCTVCIQVLVHAGRRLYVSALTCFLSVCVCVCSSAVIQTHLGVASFIGRVQRGHEGGQRHCADVPLSPLSGNSSPILTTRSLCSCHRTWRCTVTQSQKAQIVAAVFWLRPRFSASITPDPPTGAAKHLPTMQQGKMNEPVLWYSTGWLTIPWAATLRLSNFWTAVAR